MTGPIEGKVARLLTVRDLVINRGTNDGVEIGMRFKILNSKGEAIRDPDTKRIIGNVEMIKVIVKVVEVQAELCVARTFRTITTEASGVYGATAIGLSTLAASMGRPGGERLETLRSNEKFAEDDINENESYVHTGDPAVQIIKISDELDL